MDFFVVPTVNFTFVYVFFIIEHARRKILHFNVTGHPSADWMMQQLREAFPFDSAPRYLIFDRDSIFSPQVKQCIRNMHIQPKLISYQAPWQNGIAERRILSARDDLLNHMIVLSEGHIRRVLAGYIDYYNNNRCHLSLYRNTPKGRAIKHKPSEAAR
ncbi:MAG: integrase core domain-containing protein [bacterium]